MAVESSGVFSEALVLPGVAGGHAVDTKKAHPLARRDIHVRSVRAYRLVVEEPC